MPNNSARFFMSGISSGVTHNEVNYRLYAGAFSSGIVHRNLNTNKGIVAKEDSFTVGDMNFDAISTTGNYGKLAETSLSFKDSSGTVVLDKGDVGVTNKLKALTAATSGANSKMLIYDTGTSAFNYTDIPSGGVGTVISWIPISVCGGFKKCLMEIIVAINARAKLLFRILGQELIRMVLNSALSGIHFRGGITYCQRLGALRRT
jgi:hypothetical protein